MKHLSDGNSSLIKNRHTRNEALGIFQIRSNSCGWKKSSGLCKSECKSNFKQSHSQGTVAITTLLFHAGFTDEAVCDDLRCAIENQKKSGFGYWSEYNSKCNPFIKGFEVLPNLNKLRCFDDNVNILIAMKPRFCK